VQDERIGELLAQLQAERQSRPVGTITERRRDGVVAYSLSRYVIPRTASRINDRTRVGRSLRADERDIWTVDLSCSAAVR
jgi:hypothetical protein